MPDRGELTAQRSGRCPVRQPSWKRILAKAGVLLIDVKELTLGPSVGHSFLNEFGAGTLRIRRTH